MFIARRGALYHAVKPLSPFWRNITRSCNWKMNSRPLLWTFITAEPISSCCSRFLFGDAPRKSACGATDDLFVLNYGSVREYLFQVRCVPFRVTPLLSDSHTKGWILCAKTQHPASVVSGMRSIRLNRYSPEPRRKSRHESAALAATLHIRWSLT